MDWKFWLPFLVNIVCMVLAYKQLRLMQPQTQHSEITKSNFKRYWPIIVSFILVIGAWVPYYAYDSKTSGGRILAQWGTGEGETCAAVLNSGLLMKFKDTFGIAVVCGFKNSKIDKLKDTDISVSSIFTIRPGPIEISIPLSQQMTKAFKDRVERANKEAIESQKEYAKLKTSIWFEVVLLPKSVNTLDIHKLADVPRNGGQIPGLGIIK